uniref:RING-type domain-containing protein n=1 Tax=Chromera velia CCMP2878 TaxID=1169474 RepID=A0A0G4I6X1_9ALVE|eukprot:Cvel_11540.t1-p1 / transcript=Cvel_11540.t1 / gene=Cvel_11540 / organism=Chromera_velia_CCMP2878 / gene_product=F-box protein At3g54460, putative / transcript_product=F-box protein At3g54460, putative / location=Cvel_scaffold728:57851-69512(+) / protein_length=2462 / sequence_SO=supercontig / SO=protein_coding / is_pseudo=false
MPGDFLCVGFDRFRLRVSDEDAASLFPSSCHVEGEPGKADESGSGLCLYTKRRDDPSGQAESFLPLSVSVSQSPTGHVRPPSPPSPGFSTTQSYALEVLSECESTKSVQTPPTDRLPLSVHPPLPLPLERETGQDSTRRGPLSTLGQSLTGGNVKRVYTLKPWVKSETGTEKEAPPLNPTQTFPPFSGPSAPPSAEFDVAMKASSSASRKEKQGSASAFSSPPELEMTRIDWQRFAWIQECLWDWGPSKGRAAWSLRPVSTPCAVASDSPKQTELEGDNLKKSSLELCVYVWVDEKFLLDGLKKKGNEKKLQQVLAVVQPCCPPPPPSSGFGDMDRIRERGEQSLYFAVSGTERNSEVERQTRAKVRDVSSLFEALPSSVSVPSPFGQAMSGRDEGRKGEGRHGKIGQRGDGASYEDAGHAAAAAAQSSMGTEANRESRELDMVDGGAPVSVCLSSTEASCPSLFDVPFLVVIPFLQLEDLRQFRATCRFGFSQWEQGGVTPSFLPTLYPHQLGALRFMLHREGLSLPSSSPSVSESVPVPVPEIRRDRDGEGDTENLVSMRGPTETESKRNHLFPFTEDQTVERRVCPRFRTEEEGKGSHAKKGKRKGEEKGRSQKANVATRLSPSLVHVDRVTGLPVAVSKNAFRRRVREVSRREGDRGDRADIRRVRDFRGGMLCDEPGLGKTVTVLALLMKTRGMLPFVGCDSSCVGMSNSEAVDKGYLSRCALSVGGEETVVWEWRQDQEHEIGRTSLDRSCKRVEREGETQCGDNDDEEEESSSLSVGEDESDFEVAREGERQGGGSLCVEETEEEKEKRTIEESREAGTIHEMKEGQKAGKEEEEEGGCSGASSSLSLSAPPSFFPPKPEIPECSSPSPKRRKTQTEDKQSASNHPFATPQTNRGTDKSAPSPFSPPSKSSASVKKGKERRANREIDWLDPEKSRPRFSKRQVIIPKRLNLITADDPAFFEGLGDREKRMYRAQGILSLGSFGFAPKHRQMELAAVRKGGAPMPPSPVGMRRRTGPSETWSRFLTLTAASLVVVPDELVAHWITQVGRHVVAGGLRLIVEGSRGQRQVAVVGTEEMSFSQPAASAASGQRRRSGRNNSVVEEMGETPAEREMRRVVAFVKTDVVVTTFSRLQIEMEGVMGGTSAFLKVHWKRLVIDEGHKMGATLVETNTKKVLNALSAESRWVLTGTPTRGEAVEKLWPLLEFLRDPSRLQGHRFSKAVTRRLTSKGTLALRRYSCSGEGGTGEEGEWSVCKVVSMREREQAWEALRSILERICVRTRKADCDAFLPPLRYLRVPLNFSKMGVKGYNTLCEIVQRNLLLADWFDPTHSESLLYRENRQFREIAMSNLVKACSVTAEVEVYQEAWQVPEIIDWLRKHMPARRALAPDSHALPLASLSFSSSVPAVDTEKTGVSGDTEEESLAKRLRREGTIETDTTMESQQPSVSSSSRIPSAVCILSDERLLRIDSSSSSVSIPSEVTPAVPSLPISSVSQSHSLSADSPLTASPLTDVAAPVVPTSVHPEPNGTLPALDDAPMRPSEVEQEDTTSVTHLDSALPSEAHTKRPRSPSPTASERFRSELEVFLDTLRPRISSSTPCDVCSLMVEMPLVTPCGHLSCCECIASCPRHCPLPSCQAPYLFDRQGDPKELIELQPAWLNPTPYWKANWWQVSSTKLEWLLPHVKRRLVADRGERGGSRGDGFAMAGKGRVVPKGPLPKILIFSRFIETLEVVKQNLIVAAGFRYFDDDHALKGKSVREAAKEDEKLRADAAALGEHNPATDGAGVAVGAVQLEEGQDRLPFWSSALPSPSFGGNERGGDPGTSAKRVSPAGGIQETGSGGVDNGGVLTSSLSSSSSSSSAAAALPSAPEHQQRGGGEESGVGRRLSSSSGSGSSPPRPAWPVAAAGRGMGGDGVLQRSMSAAASSPVYVGHSEDPDDWVFVTEFYSPMPGNIKLFHLNQFVNNPRAAVLLCDKTAALGLDLSMVTDVILMDPVCDPLFFHQLVSRAHRLGAREPVTVYQLYMRQSIEEIEIEETDKSKRVSSGKTGNSDADGKEQESRKGGYGGKQNGREDFPRSISEQTTKTENTALNKEEERLFDFALQKEKKKETQGIARVPSDSLNIADIPCVRSKGRGGISGGPAHASAGPTGGGPSSASRRGSAGARVSGRGSAGAPRSSRPNRGRGGTAAVRGRGQSDGLSNPVPSLGSGLSEAPAPDTVPSASSSVFPPPSSGENGQAMPREHEGEEAGDTLSRESGEKGGQAAEESRNSSEILQIAESSSSPPAADPPSTRSRLSCRDSLGGGRRRAPPPRHGELPPYHLRDIQKSRETAEVADVQRGTRKRGPPPAQRQSLSLPIGEAEQGGAEDREGDKSAEAGEPPQSAKTSKNSGQKRKREKENPTSPGEEKEAESERAQRELEEYENKRTAEREKEKEKQKEDRELETVRHILFRVRPLRQIVS